MEIVPATLEHKPLLENLLELYMYELSALHPEGFTVDSTGRFGYKYTPLYFTEPHRHAFIVYQSDEPCGFVLVNNDCRFDNSDFWMAEFFIMRKFQRRGLGTEVAHEIFRKFNGNWEVGVAYTAIGEQDFWRKCIYRFTESFTEQQTTKEHHNWRGVIFRFRTDSTATEHSNRADLAGTAYLQ